MLDAKSSTAECSLNEVSGLESPLGRGRGGLNWAKRKFRSGKADPPRPIGHPSEEGTAAVRFCSVRGGRCLLERISSQQQSRFPRLIRCVVAALHPNLLALVIHSERSRHSLRDANVTARGHRPPRTILLALLKLDILAVC